MIFRFELKLNRFYKNIISYEIAPNFTYLQKSSFLKNERKQDKAIMLLPYTFYGRDMYIGKVVFFFIFASCEPLISNMVIFLVWSHFH